MSQEEQKVIPLEQEIEVQPEPPGAPVKPKRVLSEKQRLNFLKAQQKRRENIEAKKREQVFDQDKFGDLIVERLFNRFQAEAKASYTSPPATVEASTDSEVEDEEEPIPSPPTPIKRRQPAAYYTPPPRKNHHDWI